MFETIFFILLIWFHWFGDYVLQTSYQAENKSINNKALFSHGLNYSIVLLVFSLCFNLSFWWVILNALLHILVDYISSRITKKLYKDKDFHNFFVILGLDQAIHLTILFISAYFLTI